MNVPQPIRPALAKDTALNMREVAHILGVSPLTATAKVRDNADALHAWKTSGKNGQWRVRLRDLQSFFNLKPR